MLATRAPCSRAQSRGDHQESHQRRNERNERDEPVVPSYSDARIFAGLLGVVHFLVLSLCVSAFTAGAVYAVPTCQVALCRSGADRRGRRGDSWLRIPSLMIDARFATSMM